VSSAPPTSVSELSATRATLWGHLFEKAATGLPRDVYWGIRVELEPLEVDGSEWPTSLAVEWLRFPVRSWRALADTPPVLDLAETSLYCAYHQDAQLVHLSLAAQSETSFDLSLTVRATLEVPGLGPLPEGELALTMPATLEEVIVVRDNLFPKPSSPAEAAEALGRFLDPEEFEPAVYEGFRYVFRPRS
jgi:hypothetical protein